jgi:hypothetical protein
VYALCGASAALPPGTGTCPIVPYGWNKYGLLTLFTATLCVFLLICFPFILFYDTYASQLLHSEGVLPDMLQLQGILASTISAYRDVVGFNVAGIHTYILIHTYIHTYIHIHYTYIHAS